MGWRSGQSYSQDLRDRVLGTADGGTAASLFARLRRRSGWHCVHLLWPSAPVLLSVEACHECCGRECDVGIERRIQFEGLRLTREVPEPEQTPFGSALVR